jgi:hypothetical protein
VRKDHRGTAGGTAGLKVKSGLKGGRLAANHTGPGLKVKSGLKGGRLAANHNARLRG